MYLHSIVGTGRYTTSTTNMYNKDTFHVQTNGVRAHCRRLRLDKDVRDQGIHLCVAVMFVPARGQNLNRGQQPTVVQQPWQEMGKSVCVCERVCVRESVCERVCVRECVRVCVRVCCESDERLEFVCSVGRGKGQTHARIHGSKVD